MGKRVEIRGQNSGINATLETPKLSESISLYPDHVYLHTCIPQKFATTPVLATIIIRSLKPPPTLPLCAPKNSIVPDRCIQ